MAQEAAGTAPEGLVVAQGSGVDQDGLSSLRNAVKSHKFAKG